MKLHNLGLQHNSDKATYHNYCVDYEKFTKDKNINTVVEVGIWEGGSLRMWSDFWPKAKVVGIDIDRTKLITEGNIISFYGDQANPINTIVPIIEQEGCDLFVDDGSHLWSHQIDTFNAVFPILKSGAIYILEDLHTSLWGAPYNNCSMNPLNFITTYVMDNMLKYQLIDKNNRSSISILIER